MIENCRKVKWHNPRYAVFTLFTIVQSASTASSIAIGSTVLVGALSRPVAANPDSKTKISLLVGRSACLPVMRSTHSTVVGLPPERHSMPIRINESATTVSIRTSSSRPWAHRPVSATQTEMSRRRQPIGPDRERLSAGWQIPRRAQGHSRWSSWRWRSRRP
jgi:hypothetical protein